MLSLQEQVAPGTPHQAIQVLRLKYPGEYRGRRSHPVFVIEHKSGSGIVPSESEEDGGGSILAIQDPGVENPLPVRQTIGGGNQAGKREQGLQGILRTVVVLVPA